MSDATPPTPEIAAVDEHGTVTPPSSAHEVTGAAASSAPAPGPQSASPETEAVIEMIRRGLAPNADEAAQAMARQICARIAQVPPPPPPPVAAPLHPGFGPGPSLSQIPESPLTAATRALSQLPPEQLLDMVLQRLRAALPAGAAVATPKGIQFSLVPVVPPSGSR